MPLRIRLDLLANTAKLPPVCVEVAITRILASVLFSLRLDGRLNDLKGSPMFSGILETQAREVDCIAASDVARHLIELFAGYQRTYNRRAVWLTFKQGFGDGWGDLEAVTLQFVSLTDQSGVRDQLLRVLLRS